MKISANSEKKSKNNSISKFKGYWLLSALFSYLSISLFSFVINLFGVDLGFFIITENNGKEITTSGKVIATIMILFTFGVALINNWQNAKNAQEYHKNGEFQHKYDSIYGVMSDSLPIQLFTEYRAGIISKENVINGLLKPSSMKQLSLHNQELCDKLKLSRAYSIDIATGERKELNFNDLNKIT